MREWAGTVTITPGTESPNLIFHFPGSLPLLQGYILLPQGLSIPLSTLVVGRLFL